MLASQCELVDQEKENNMSRIFTFLGVPVLAVAMVLAGETPKADAGGLSITFGTGGYAVPGYRYSSGYSGYGYSGYRSNYGHRAFGPVIYPSSGIRYHSGYRGSRTPHYDYHAPSIVPHGNHFHYQPGHYDLHYGRHGHH